MSTTEELARWLATWPVERLTELLEERELPYAARAYGASGPGTMRELAQYLLGDSSTAKALADLNTPQSAVCD